MSASGRIWGTWVSRYVEPKACRKQWVLRRRRKVWIEEESQVPDESEFQIISAKWTKWMAEILFSFDVVLSVCLSVCVCARSGPVNQTSLKRLKLRTSNLTCMFPVKDRTWPLNIFRKGAWSGSRDQNFWALNANSSKTVKAADFKFDVHVSRDSPDMTPYFQKEASVETTWRRYGLSRVPSSFVWN